MDNSVQKQETTFVLNKHTRAYKEQSIGRGVFDEVVQIGNPILRQKAKPAVRLATLDDMLENMWEIVHSLDAVGLAAPQVGVSLRVAVVHADGWNVQLVNPEILEQSGEQTFIEGCLSIPYVISPITRAVKIRVKTDYDIFEATGLLAQAIQHEIDHLDGILIIDKIICQGYCGALGWTVEKYKRVTHKHSCPHRTELYCQAHPDKCEEI